MQVSEIYSKELKGAISAVASLQGHLLIASGPKITLHKWTGSELNGVAFFDAPPLYVVSMNIVCFIFPFYVLRSNLLVRISSFKSFVLATFLFCCLFKQFIF